ncbi:hypothetical protein [Herbiconiux liukaitaii]|uniref:hypothetical protein n=1 Tax=Herbiconiux liukaitaii TaxID=3342799 RepID=UPI0035B8B991
MDALTLLVIISIVVIGLLAAVLGVGISVLLLRRSAARRQGAEDLRRAGNDPDQASGDAARRAEGTQAWMRIGGGGM